MKRAKEDNTVGIIQRAIKHLRIRVIKSSVKEVLRSHPDYPTFKSICDTLNEWKIEHYPLKYDIDELNNLEAPYIVHFDKGGGQIGFVTDIEDEFVICYTSYNIKRKFLKKEFLESCSGAVILLNPDEHSGEKDFPAKWKNELISKSILPLILSAILLMIIYSVADHFISEAEIPGKVIPALIITKSAGIILSVLLILYEFEVHLSLTDKLCHLNKATNCNTVLHDKASKVFGWFGWADAGFVYFTGSFLFLLQSPAGEGLSLMAILAALSVPYPIFSIYYQGFVLKKWCLMCLGVQLILITEFILLLPQLSQLTFSFDSFTKLVLTLLVITIVYTLFILLRREQLSDEMHYYKYLGFKKNPDILKMLLMNQPHYVIPTSENSLIFGNSNSSVKITAFLSLHCSHCARAYEKIRNMLNDKEDLLINLMLMTSDNKMLNTLYNYNRQGNSAGSLKLLEQWFSTDPYSRTKITESLCIPEDTDISGEVNKENGRLFKECNVMGTPTFFINGYKLPSQYEIDDIRYFRDIIDKRVEKSSKASTVN
ncbi:MAG: thioredoxin domain-containing protein [Bacteroidales bacterium]|nr:thioredoxin domain-containing protein [Bacteroidales bacterium]